MKQQAVPQHKQMAMGKKVGFAKGGMVPAAMPAAMPMRGTKLLKTGTPDTPLEKAKIANGIPGMKKGGMVKKGMKAKC